MKNWMIISIIGGIMLLVIIFRKKINKAAMFDILIGIILKHEGGYVNDPDDAGGETKYGITKARYPNLDIKNLTKAQAIEIYRRDFYVPMKIDQITNMNLALHHFDMGVNAGIKNAEKIMQQAKEESKKGKNIVQAYKDLRIEYYKKVAELRNNKKFLAGWLNRVESSRIA
jgi:hypothetical protein